MPPERDRNRRRSQLNLDELVKKQPDWVQRDLKVVSQQQDTILKALKDPKNQELLIRDPATLLARLNVPVSDRFKKKMRADTSGRELTKPVAVRLPNGQILKPKVRIHFRKGR